MVVTVFGPRVQQPGQLAGPGAGMLGQRRQQLQLSHGQSVAGIGDPGAAAQGTALPGNRLGQAVRPQASLSAALAAARQEPRRPRSARRTGAVPQAVFSGHAAARCKSSTRRPTG